MSFTNYDRWLLLTKDLCSPDNYIKWGWIFLNSAALQRRIWLPPDHHPRFFNSYVIYVGPPGVGKGEVIRPIIDLLKHHRMENPVNAKNMEDMIKNVKDKELLKQTLMDDYKMAQETEFGKNKSALDRPLVFPIAPDAVTYEDLVQTMAKSIRRINYMEYSEEFKKDIMKIYTHSSMAFCLEELSSLFRRHTEDTVNFFLRAYDCGDYDKSTKTSGKDRIRKMCLSMLAGTQPDFMEEILGDRLINQGFSSRCFYIYADKPRHRKFFHPALTESQKLAHNELLVHLKGLSELYGRVRIDEDTYTFLQDWLEKSDSNRPNPDPKMDHYYSRKDNHVAKVAGALHFGDSLEMHIPKSRFEEAIELLATEEKTMHLALGFETNNPLSKPANRILNYIGRYEGRTKKQLMVEFWNQLPDGAASLDLILEHLTKSAKIYTDDSEPINGITVTIYKAHLNGHIL